MKNIFRIFRKRALYFVYFKYSGMKDGEKITGNGGHSFKMFSKIKSFTALTQIRETIKNQLEKEMSDVTIVIIHITRLD